VKFSKPAGELGAQKNMLRELEMDLALAAARGGLSAPQLGEFHTLLQKWIPVVASKLPKDSYAILQNGLPAAAALVEKEAMEARKGHQLHLCGDGAQDARGRSVFLTTAEFGGGKSQIVDVSFPVSSLNHKSLGEMNAKIMLELGGSKKIDSYHHDAVAYGFKWGNETLANTFTIFLTDVCHRFDGILDAMIESCPAVEKIISCCNSLFKSTNRAQVSDFKSFIELKGYQFKQYPSPGQIRAWTGDYRVLEWLFLYYELLVSYINETFHLVKNPSEKLVELKDFCRNDSESGDFKIVLAWFLQYCRYCHSNNGVAVPDHPNCS
jgi:hypothetical protein